MGSLHNNGTLNKKLFIITKICLDYERNISYICFIHICSNFVTSPFSM